MLRHGWRTAAIVPELEQETKVVSTDRFGLSLTWLQALTGLMERLQVRSDYQDCVELSLRFYVGADHITALTHLRLSLVLKKTDGDVS